MPWSSNATLLVEVRHGDDCLRAVYKPRRGERPLWDFPAGLDRREVAAYELSAWLGWDIVPETVLRDDGLPFGVGSLQRFVTLRRRAALLHADRGRRPPRRPPHDLLLRPAWPTAPTARAGTAWPGDDGRLWAVDNGLTFHCETKLRTVIWDFGGEPIPDHLLAGLRRLADDGPAGRPAASSLLDPAERTGADPRGRGA